MREKDLEHTEVHDGRCEFKKMDLRSTSVAAVNNNNVCKFVLLYYSVLLLKNKQTNVLKTNTVIKVNRRSKDAFSYRKTHNWRKTSLRNCSTSLATREEQMEATVHLLNDC